MGKEKRKIKEEPVDEVETTPQKRKRNLATVDVIIDAQKRKSLKEKEADYDDVTDITVEESSAYEEELNSAKKKKKKKKDKMENDFTNVRVKFDVAGSESDVAKQTDEEDSAVRVDGDGVQTAKKKDKDKEKKPHTSTMGMNLSHALRKLAERQILSYEDGLRRISEDKKCGLCVKLQKRHVSLPYHMASAASTQHALQYIASSALGRYKKELKGVVVSVGEVKTAGQPRVLDDQNVFHIDAFIKQIVFKPRKSDIYSAKVQHISQDMVVALVMNAITVHVPINAKFEAKLQGLTLDVGDLISVRYRGMRIRRALCHLEGELIKILEKTTTIVKEEAAEPKASGHHTKFQEPDDDGSE